MGYIIDKFTKFAKSKNHSSDPATKFGITIDVFKKYAASFNLDPTEGALKKLTMTQALTITLNEFWNTKSINFEALLEKNKSLAKVVFETYFNAPERTKERFKLAVQGTDFNTLGSPSDSTIRIVFTRFVDSMDTFYENSMKAKTGFSGLKTKMDKYRNDSLYLGK